VEQEQTNPLVGQNWNGLLSLVKLVAAMQTSHQIQETSHDPQTKQRKPQPAAAGVAQSAAGGSTTGGSPAGQALKQTDQPTVGGER
jgi:hypothetical protein